MVLLRMGRRAHKIGGRVQGDADLRTASPAEADRSPREGEICLLGEQYSLSADP
jgi:hypothetical protein